MILGIDFDNTLVCYDGLFHAAAVEQGWMPEDGPRDKDGVRAWFIQHDREADFTWLQGEVYGPRLGQAKPYPGALECLGRARAAGAALCIISHKTRTPVLGPAHDLRGAALDWLERQGVYGTGLVQRHEVFFEETLSAKSQRIAACGCTHFIDDMERFLLRPDFPAGVERWWFRPGSNSEEAISPERVEIFSTWRELDFGAWAGSVGIFKKNLLF